MKKLVIMNGSFNPVTNGHYYSIKDAIDYINADFGIFLPASHEYVVNKMKDKNESFVLDSNTRVDMLKCYERIDSKIKVSLLEANGTLSSNHTYMTLKAISSEYPDYLVYLTVGADQVINMKNWKTRDKLLSEFNFIVINRSDINVNEIINNDNVLSKYKEHFTIINPKNDTTNISSSMVRKLYLSNNDSYKMYLNDEVVKILNKKVK